MDASGRYFINHSPTAQNIKYSAKIKAMVKKNDTLSATRKIFGYSSFNTMD
jgi:hypothetical protein